MKELHRMLLDIYKPLKKEFEKNNVRHFAIGGTAIGAFREHGFIEWDDDMDFAIYEEDIEKLNEIAISLGLCLEDKTFTAVPMIKIYDQSKVIVINGVKRYLFIDFMIAQKKRKWTKGKWAIHNVIKFLGTTRTQRFSEIKAEENFFIAAGYKTVKFLTFFITRNYLKKKIMSDLLGAPLAEQQDDKVRYLYHVKIDEPYNISKMGEKEFEDTFVTVNLSFPEDMFDVFGNIMIKPDKEERENHNIEIGA